MNRLVRSNLIILTIATAILGSFAPVAHAQRALNRDEVKELNGLPIDEQLGNHVPLNAVFTNSEGEQVRFGSYFEDDKPAILVMVYYECPVVCQVVLSQLKDSLNKLDYTAGEDFRLLVVSFDQSETTSMALGERTNFLGEYNKGTTAAAQSGIAFHTGDVPNIHNLVNSIGFNFNPLTNGDYSHPVSLMILSPKGKVTRYMYGFDYPPQELKLSLLDASQGKIAASLGDRLLHFCYRLDPNAGAYSIAAMQVMKLGAILTMIVLAIGLTLLFMGDRVRRKKYLAQQASNNTNTDDSHSSKTSSGALAGANTGRVS